MDRNSDRAQFEEGLVAKYFPGFAFLWNNGRLYVEGWVSDAAGANQFQLRVDVPSDYPHAKPSLYVVNPTTLPKRGGGTINSEGNSHSWHTFRGGPGGCVQVCHTRSWDASLTLPKVILKGVLWIEAYAGHLRTGRDIAHFLG